MKRLAYEPAVEGPDMLRLYLKDISKYPQLTPAQEHDLGVLARSGDQNALRRLVESNLRFVVSLAKKYSRSGFPMHELINEGNMGLIEAASRFDPERGVRFVTYAGWWVRQAILAAIARYGQVFHLPPKLKHELYQFQTKVSRLTQELGHKPSIEEISRRFRMSEADVEEMIQGPPSEVSQAIRI
jgi:RNA polymerase primary sigma factor